MKREKRKRLVTAVTQLVKGRALDIPVWVATITARFAVVVGCWTKSHGQPKALTVATNAKREQDSRFAAHNGPGAFCPVDPSRPTYLKFSLPRGNVQAGAAECRHICGCVCISFTFFAILALFVGASHQVPALPT
ncbi:MAG: hypothetical protein L0312_13420, partial [Acidobacteria bacterium]|nr:hypothetical protein [Acidobacteriota bacterium]